MRTCKICEQQFEIIDKGHTRIYCYECCPTYSNSDKKSLSRRQVAMRQAMKRQGMKILGERCSRCGYDKCVAALQFHHINGRDTDFKFNDSFHSWERYKQELAKCKLLCANCHAEHHWNESSSKQ